MRSPVAAGLRLLVGPKRIGIVTELGFALTIVAFAYLAFPVMGAAAGRVDSWIIGPTAFLSFFIGIVPPIFAGLARIATANWKMNFGADLVVTVLLAIGGPFGAYVVIQVAEAIWRSTWKNGHTLSETAAAVTGHVAAVGVVLGTLLLFTGILRLMHLVSGRFLSRDADSRRIVTALFFGLVFPWAGLALNLRIPFPADFANPWPWVLSAVTTLAMIVETKPSRGGLALWFLKLAMAPFVLYFFLLFVPFLPLAVLAILAMGAGERGVSETGAGSPQGTPGRHALDGCSHDAKRVSRGRDCGPGEGAQAKGARGPLRQQGVRLRGGRT